MNYKLCPKCNEFNDINAEKCEWCREKLAPPGKNICSNCYAIVEANVKVCPCCKTNIKEMLENVCPKCHSPISENLNTCKTCGYNIKNDIEEKEEVNRIIEEHQRTNKGPLLIIGNKQIDPSILNFLKKGRMIFSALLFISMILLFFKIITVIEIVFVLKIILFLVAIALLVIFLQKNSDNSKKNKIFPIISVIIIGLFLVEDYLPLNFKDYSKKEIVTIKGYEIPTMYKYIKDQKAFWSLNVKNEVDSFGKHSYISLIYLEEFNKNSINEYSDFLKKEGYELVSQDEEESIYQKKVTDKYIQIEINKTSINYIVTTGGI